MCTPVKAKSNYIFSYSNMEEPRNRHSQSKAKSALAMQLTWCPVSELRRWRTWPVPPSWLCHKHLISYCQAVSAPKLPLYLLVIPQCRHLKYANMSTEPESASSNSIPATQCQASDGLHGLIESSSYHSTKGNNKSDMLTNYQVQYFEKIHLEDSTIVITVS